jgi:hypothetical protein
MIIDVKLKSCQTGYRENSKPEILSDFIYAKKPLPNTYRNEINKHEKEFIKNFSKILKKTITNETFNQQDINSDNLNKMNEFKSSSLPQKEQVNCKIIKDEISK